MTHNSLKFDWFLAYLVNGPHLYRKKCNHATGHRQEESKLGDLPDMPSIGLKVC